MRIIVITTLFTVCNILANAQQQVTIKLNTHAKDDRFDRLNINLPLFDLKNDTILSWDFEGMKEARPLLVVKPIKYNMYAYGYLFFAGNQQGYNPGLITFLVANPYQKYPLLFLDLNNNLNFTDDGEPTILPWRGDSALLTFCLPNTLQCASIKLTRHPHDDKFAYKNLVKEFYEFTYPNRTFLGMEHCYRQQSYQTKSGLLVIGKDSLQIALYDGNQNGMYNQPDSDIMVIANLHDTVFYPFDALYASPISKKVSNCFIDKNGNQIAFVSALDNGSELTINIAAQANNTGQIKPGKKLPKFKYITWKGEQQKITKWRKQQLYIYYGSPQTTGFSADTIALRKIAAEYGNTIKVIGFIEVNKSYELSIFGQYSHLNWILAYKDKYLNQKLSFKGIPSSIYTKKRRRVIQYNLTPEQLLLLLATK